MFWKALLLVLFATSGAFAKEVCFVESNIQGYEDGYGYVVSTCSIAKDSSSTRIISAKAAEEKVLVIKALLEKGYEIKSDTLLVK